MRVSLIGACAWQTLSERFPSITFQQAEIETNVLSCSGDGRADPICSEISGGMTAWLNRQGGLLDAGQIKFAESWDRANIRFADVENSGRADIIWMNKYTGVSTVFKNNG